MRLKLFFAMLLLIPLACAATPFWGAKQSSPAETPLEQLKPGEFIWEGQLEKSGPIVIVVSLTDQLAHVYRNGVRVGVATMSTGNRLYQEIALKAYFRAQARGFAPGGEEQDWIEAEQEVNAAHAELT